MDGSTFALTALLSSIILLILLILKAKLHAFIALLTTCFYLGFITGMPLPKIAASIQAGVADILGFLACVIGLGTILGKLLEYSGGAEVLATTMLKKMGEKRAALVMTIVGVLAGISVFVEVGFVLLFPIVFFVAKKAKLPLFYLGIPLAVALMIVHCMVPPHPAAFAITISLGADVGKVILYSLLISTPTAILAGPVWSKWITKHLKGESESNTSKNLDDQANPLKDATTLPENAPGFGITLFTIILPLLIMVARTILLMTLDKGSSLVPAVELIGNPLTALFISVLFAYYALGLSKGKTMDNLLAITDECFKPIAGILLIIGAGGAFNQMLIDSHLGASLSLWLSSLNMSPILLAWFVAFVLHGAIGSATVAMIGAAGMVSPLLAYYPGLQPEIVVLAIGSGAIGLTHVNDSLFWLVKEFLGVSLQNMFKGFSSACLLASLISLTGIYLLSMFI
ncbi:MAG: gluconate:H+ symporter [Veillonella sp.]|uniref:GntT/GntP/DsdX family permease n=1 Tax=Veillonella sp. TaxID=1926307 RepID=UPI0025F7D3BB|nr:gluconate:H+ symporter [Veillonella sp.]MBS4913093.1 gluconate:H+ symporter [Veillonella sp.]